MNIIHVKLENPTMAEYHTMKDFLETNLNDLPDDVKIVVSEDTVTMTEVPELDNYIDELAEAVVAKMEERELRQ